MEHSKQRLAQRSTSTGSYPRLTQPLVREGGVLRPASWGEALDRAADGFRRNIAARGPDALGIFSCSNRQPW